MAFDGSMSKIHISNADPDGRVILTAHNHVLSLRFDWWAIASMQDEWGDEFLQVAAKGLDRLDLQTLAQMASMASRKSPEEIMDMSMPIIPLAEALGNAWRASWHGFDTKQVSEDDGEPKKMKARLKWLAGLWKQPFRRASNGRTSGE